MRGPIPADGIFSYMGYLFLYVDNVLYRNNGLSPHLFYPRQYVRVYPEPILGGVGLEGGFWVVTAWGTWFVSGDRPENWRDIKKDTRKYAKGGIAVSGRLFPSLQVDALIALFVSEDGLMAGLPDGRMVALTQDRLPLDVTDKRADIVVRETGGFRQVLFSLSAI